MFYRARQVLLAFLFLAQGACVAFTGGQLPARSPDEHRLAEPAPESRAHLRFAYKVNDKTLPHVTATAEKMRMALERTGHFNNLSLQIVNPEEPTAAPQDGLLLDVVLHERFNQTAVFVSNFLSGYTLGLIPGYSRVEYDIAVTASRDSRPLKRYHYQETQTILVQILLLPASPFMSVGKAMDKLIDGAAYQLVADMKADALLQPRPAAVPGRVSPGRSLRLLP